MLVADNISERDCGQSSWPGNATFRETSGALLGGAEQPSSKVDRRSNVVQCTHIRLVYACLAILATGALFGALARAILVADHCAVDKRPRDCCVRIAQQHPGTHQLCCAYRPAQPSSASLAELRAVLKSCGLPAGLYATLLTEVAQDRR